MKIKDYIYYRVYQSFKKADEFGRINTMLYFTFIEFFLCVPFIVLISSFFHLEGIWKMCAIFLPIIVLFSLNFIKYRSKAKTVRLINKYRNNQYNKKIKNWMIYSLPIISAVLGLILIAPVLKLFILIVNLWT